MKPDDYLLKAQREKIEAKLQGARARLDELEANAKERKAQAVIDAIVALRAKRDAIQARVRELTAEGDVRSEQIKADIDAKVSDFLEEVSQLARQLKARVKTASHKG